MTVTLCPFCDTPFTIPDIPVVSGQTATVACPHCGREFRVRFVVEVEYAEPMPLPDGAEKEPTSK